MMQGVSTALLRMTQCGEKILSKNKALPTLVNPLQFGIGDDDAKYARGAIVGNLVIIPLACVVLFYYAIPWVVSVARHGAHFASAFATFRPRTGWPANMIVPFSVLAEGSAMTSVALLSYSEASAFDIFLGVFGVVVMLVTAVIWALKLRYPFLRLQCVKLPYCLPSVRWCTDVGGELQCVRAELQKTWLTWSLSPRWEWTLSFQQRIRVDKNDSTSDNGMLALLPTPNESFAVTTPRNGSFSNQQRHRLSAEEQKYFLKRWSFLIGDSWWLWSSFFAFAFSLLVGIAEGMPSETTAICRVRWSMASIGAVGQAIVVLTNTIPAELFFIGLSSLLSCALVVLIALSTFGAFGGENEALNDAFELVGTISSGFSLIITGVGVVCSLIELYRRWTPRKKAVEKEEPFLDDADVEIELVGVSTEDSPALEEVSTTALPSLNINDAYLDGGSAAEYYDCDGGSMTEEDMAAQHRIALPLAEEAAPKPSSLSASFTSATLASFVIDVDATDARFLHDLDVYIEKRQRYGGIRLGKKRGSAL